MTWLVDFTTVYALPCRRRSVKTLTTNSHAVLEGHTEALLLQRDTRRALRDALVSTNLATTKHHILK